MDVKASASEVQVFDSQVEGLANSQAAGVKQVNDKTGGIVVDIRHMSQEFESFTAIRAIAQARRPFGSQCIDVAQLLFDHVSVEEQEGVKGLVLGRGRDSVECECSEEGFHLFFGLREGFGCGTL